MIDYGYIILFTIAFPVGALIAMVIGAFEIKLKMLSFLYVFKRPKA
jgi:hypothetical protein